MVDESGTIVKTCTRNCSFISVDPVKDYLDMIIAQSNALRNDCLPPEMKDAKSQNAKQKQFLIPLVVAKAVAEA